MNKQELQEYIKKYIQETETSVVTDDPQSKMNIKKKITQSALPGPTKVSLTKQVDQSKKGDSFTLEEESQTYGDAITKTYMYLDAIYDRLEDMYPESPQAQELKAKFDDFNDNILKPIFRDIIGR
jgi:hypothetical protein